MDWFETSKIALGLDLATSAALIFSAIGVLWRVSVLSRRLQKEQINSQQEESKKSLVSFRERSRAEFLLKLNDDLQDHIISLTKVFADTVQPVNLENSGEIDGQIRSTVQENWNWLRRIEPRFLAIGTQKQIEALKRAQRHFVQSVDSKSSSFNVAPREMVSSLVKLQKEILVDTRMFLFFEERPEAEKNIEDNLG